MTKEIPYDALIEMEDGRLVAEGSDFGWTPDEYPSRILVRNIPKKGDLLFSNWRPIKWIGSEGYAYKNKEAIMEIQVFND